MSANQIAVTITAAEEDVTNGQAWDEVSGTLTLLDGGGWMILDDEGSIWDRSAWAEAFSLDAALAEARAQAINATIEA